MFGQSTVKNRRLNTKEFAEELEDAKIWRRPPRHYLLDKPFYPDCKPEPLVNFSLNFNF